MCISLHCKYSSLLYCLHIPKICGRVFFTEYQWRHPPDDLNQTVWGLHVCWDHILRENRADGELAKRNNWHCCHWTEWWLSSMGSEARLNKKTLATFSIHVFISRVRLWHRTKESQFKSPFFKWTIVWVKESVTVVAEKFEWEPLPKHNCSLWTLEEVWIQGILWKTSVVLAAHY